MLVYFFDIDGTLLLSGGAGRVAMTQVMQELFGLSDLHRVEVHGRTDRGIIEELFQRHDIPLDESLHQQFSARYHELLPDCMQQCDGFLMPGARELLEFLARQPQVKLGVLTGNSEAAAQTKLRHFELQHFFEFGGFGGQYRQRNDVARQTLRQCQETYPGLSIAAHQTWVVGDTIHDIACARAIGANVVAVATGGCQMDSLVEHNPDLALADLTDRQAFFAATSMKLSKPACNRPGPRDASES